MVKSKSMQVDHRNGHRAWVAALALAGVSVACDAAARAEATVPSEPVAVVQAPAVRSESLAGPPTELVPPAPGQEQLVGVVAQHLPAGGYTYLQLELEHGDPRWVVTMRRDVGTGDRVRVDNLGSRHDFYSRRLDRRFAELVFGVVEIVG
jgi:hypothetical protein